MMDFELGLVEIKKENFQGVSLSEVEWADFKAALRRFSFKKGAYLLRAGEVENYMYFMLTGVIRGYFIHEGAEHVVGFSFDFSRSGGFDSFISRQESKFFVQALADSEVVGIHYKDLQELYNRHKNFERWGRLSIEKMFIRKALHEITLMTYSAEERFNRLMRESPRCFQLIPLKHLASYLGMSAETLSRLRNKAANRT